MSLSTILRFELLDYIESICHFDGGLEVLFASHEDGEEFLFPLNIKVALGKDAGYVIVEHEGIVEAEFFHFSMPTPAAVFYAKLEILEYNKRRLMSLKIPEINEFNCRDRMLFGDWGEYEWD